MKIKNKNWIRLTTSIVIISLLYQNILLAGDKHLAPKSDKKDEMQAVMLCETIEKKARYGKLIERIYLDDILKWAESSEEGFSGCWFETLPHEIRIHLASDNIMVRYFDPSKTDSISGFKTKIIWPRLHRQIIQVVKELPAITQERTKSQTALFTMLNGVLRDFMPMVNASLAAVVLRHYPHKDASFAERLYDVIQRYSGLSSLEKLQEFNRLYPDDPIDNISAIAAEANELKKALSSEAGISSTGQKLLELFQYNLAFTISVDNPDYIKEVMGSNPSLLNAQGLLIDTLGNTGEANYDKFSHIDKVLSAYPGVKNVFLVFDAVSEIRHARKIADRLKTQGKRVHVIGVVYPMSSESARKALKSALRQAGYSGGINLDTLNLPDQSFESLSKTLVDAGADIVLSGLSSDLSQVMELYDRDRHKTEMSSLTDNDQGGEMVKKIAAIEKFKKMYGQEILRRVHGEERYRLFADKRELDINTLQEVIYQREMRFCEHILDRLITILEKANGRLGRERIFVINTSMLYDVDETIGTFSIGGWHIRPSIPFLFGFLRDNFNIKIGIASTRGKEYLDKQLQPGYEGIGTLAEISYFVDSACVYNVFTERNDLLHGRFNTIFPGFKIFDPKAGLRGLGWDEERIDRFEKVTGPALFKQSKRELYAWHYDNLDDLEQKRKLEEEVEESFRNILITTDPIGRMLSEARNLYILFFAPGNKQTDHKRSEILSKLGEFGMSLSDLETLAKICGEYFDLLDKQSAENNRVIDEFTKRISDILGLRKGREDRVIPAVYRLAAAKDLLDKGVSEVSVTIDDVYDVAEGLYELFIGKRRGPNGEDGFTLFGLDKYRDRLFIFSTSKDGVYSDYNVIQEIVEHKQKMITERFIDNIKGIPIKTSRKIILALDTDIGNMTQFEMGELLRQIKDVSSLLGDIEFVAGTGESLAGLIKDAKSKIKTDNIDVIVVTKREKKNFDSSYHVVRTDDSRLDPSSYVPILELLTFALLINLENNDVLLREIYKEITGNELTSELKEQIKNGISAIPLPPSEEISSDFYNTSIEVLKSA